MPGYTPQAISATCTLGEILHNTQHMQEQMASNMLKVQIKGRLRTLETLRGCLGREHAPGKAWSQREDTFRIKWPCVARHRTQAFAVLCTHTISSGRWNCLTPRDSHCRAYRAYFRVRQISQIISLKKVSFELMKWLLLKLEVICRTVVVKSTTLFYLFIFCIFLVKIEFYTIITARSWSIAIFYRKVVYLFWLKYH